MDDDRVAGHALSGHSGHDGRGPGDAPLRAADQVEDADEGAAGSAARAEPHDLEPEGPGRRGHAQLEAVVTDHAVLDPVGHPVRGEEGHAHVAAGADAAGQHVERGAIEVDPDLAEWAPGADDPVPLAVGDEAVDEMDAARREADDEATGADGVLDDVAAQPACGQELDAGVPGADRYGHHDQARAPGDDRRRDAADGDGARLRAEADAGDGHGGADARAGGVEAHDPGHVGVDGHVEAAAGAQESDEDVGLGDQGGAAGGGARVVELDGEGSG